MATRRRLPLFLRRMTMQPREPGLAPSMSTAISYHAPRLRAAARRTPSRRARRLIYLGALTLVTAALIGGDELLEARRPPGDAIRRELVAAAGELASPLGPYPSAAAARALRRHFRGRPAILQTTFWPQVSVTLRHLDRTTCIDARIAARRLEGLVVVELEGYRAAEDCGDDNDMSWWILP